MKNQSFSQKLKTISKIIIGVVIIACVILTLSFFAITIHYKFDPLFFFGYTLLTIVAGGLFVLLSILLYAISEILENLKNN